MASFTDQIPKFNPYIQQLPVEAMVAVGMEKQKRYDEGVQKIQTSIDNIAGLSVSKDVEKAYLQSKLNELGNNLKGFTAADFSNSQMVNSVAGMTNQLASDPYIQTAVNSSAKRKKEIEFMEKAREKGELTPQNESYFAKRDSAWANNTELGQSYNAKYVPYVDRIKYAKEIFDSIKPDNISFDEVYQKGADGNYITDKSGNFVLSESMTRIKEEGYLPEKLQATIDQIFNDPKFKQQLTIDAEYNYRSVTPEQLAVSITNETNKIKNAYEDKLDELTLQLNLNPNSVEIKQKITNTELAISKLRENFNETGELINSNPDAVKNYLYSNKERDKYTSMFNFSKKSTEELSSPRWQAKWDQQKEANAQSRWAQTEERQRWEFEQTSLDKNKDRQLQLELARIKAGQTGSSGLSGAVGVPGGLSPDVEIPFNNVLYHTKLVEEAATNKVNADVDLIWDSLFTGDTKQGETNKERLNKEMQLTVNGQPITEIEAKRRILERYAKSKKLDYNAYIENTKNSILGQYNVPGALEKLMKNDYKLYEKLNNSQETDFNFRMQNDIDKKVKGDNLAEFYKTMDNIPFEQKNVSLNGKNYTITKQDAIDLAIIAKYEDKSWLAKGNKSDNFKFETEEANGLRIAYEASKYRMEKDGKAPLIKSFLDNALLDKNTRDRLKQRTTIPSELEDEPGVAEWMFGVKDSYSRQRTYFNNKTLEGVYDFYDALNPSKFKVQIKNTDEAIRKYRSISPNLVGGITTGDNAQDQAILESLKATATAYYKNKNAIGVNADEVISTIMGLKDYKDLREANILRGIEKDGTNTPTPYIYIDGNKLIINETEASPFGINPSNIYMNEVVSTVESFIGANGGSSSTGSVKSKETYRDNDAVMYNKDFPLLSGSSYIAKVNFVKTNNKYYPYLYINDQKSVEQVIPLTMSSPSLGKLMLEDLPSLISPANIKKLLIEYPQQQ